MNEELLLQVEKPGRYAGNEVNAVMKNPREVLIRFAFAFPDVYEVGMSHLGLQLLYFDLNRRDDVYCERVFLPWVDMMALMREKQEYLYALETGDPVRLFDFIGFTLQYELCYTNVLAMLELAGIPLHSADRSDEDPLVCAGGPCACNPEPMAAFIDFFYIGDGEATLGLLMDLYREHKERGGARRAFLEMITQIPGVYVPGFYDAAYHPDGTLASFDPVRPDVPTVVKRAVIPSLADAFFPDRLIVPLIETVHDRAVLELFRGCIRGCRFCQAGYIYRPVRERGTNELLAQAESLIANTGHEEISLVSLSSCDYSAFEPLLDGLLARFENRRINIALPSLRVDAVSLSALAKTQTVRKSSLTFAPEAGSQRMRDVINKNLTEAEILEGCQNAFEAGFDKVKLYYMAGLPTESEEDLTAIARLTEDIVERYYRLPYEQRRRPVSVNISVACFVPKPFTPFQWEAQDTPEAFADKQRLIKRAFKKKQVQYRYHDAKTSVLEGVLARGDRRLGPVIERAFRLGAVLDGWTEHFNASAWSSAFEETGIDPYFYTHRERSAEELFPWDFIDMGIARSFLYRERMRAQDGQTTPNCRDACAGCGIKPFMTESAPLSPDQTAEGTVAECCKQECINRFAGGVSDV